MLEIITLQAGIGAALFIIFVSGVIFVLGSIGLWYHLSKKNSANKTTTTQYIVRFLISITVPIALILIFIALLIIWNPTLEP